MNKMLFVAVVAALLVGGCSDKDDAASGKTDSSMLEKAKESTKTAMSDIKDAASKAMDKTSEMASDASSSVGDAASDAMKGASEMASEAKTAVVATAGSAMSGAKEMVSDATEAVTDMSDDADEGDNDMESEAEMSDGGAAGQQVYQKSCQSCHAMGVAGSPKLGDKAAWAPRIATGMDALYASSINGKGIMPPKGACASCSNDDVKAAVQYMVSQSR